MASVSVKNEPVSADEVCERILALCRDFADGVGDKVLQHDMPDVDPKTKAKAINTLLNSGKIDLFKSETKGLLYRIKSGASNIKGDQEEKVVYKIIEESGNKGTWVRDIRVKSNLVTMQLNRVLKALENKKLIKVVKSVNATKKKVYMLYNLEPDRSVTGGAWYSDQDFESEFVEILNQQCFRYLQQQLDKSRGCEGGPLAARNMSLVPSSEVLKFISELGISKIQLGLEDIESILDTLVYDGKVEKTVREEEQKFYRAVEALLPTTGLVRTPCGICPVFKDCGDVGSVTPTKCVYLRDWLP